ncbi:beta-1,6-N-acetylglucosaminyltransferase [Zobellella taiwanensis]
MKVSFVLLAHEAPELLKGLIQSLLASGSNVYMHHDASTKGDIQTASAEWGLDALPGKLYLADRVKVVWGEWSIIEATLNCIKLIHKHDTDSDYFMLISGSCMPVKPVALLQEYLAQSGKDHIETVNAEKHQWVTAGLQKQRWSKYHFFNWRYQPFLFETSLKIQRKLKIKRVLPLKHTAHMGSQWWCLRRNTLMAVFDLIDKKPELRKFYKRTWVPDELIFQTLVANLIPSSEISDELLTRYTFNSWGIPRVYYDDDYPELLAESRFFVRKVSHRARLLRERLAGIAPLSVNQFARLLEQSESERAALLERITLQQHIEANRWHSLDSHHENSYDYIKSIPNRMIVLVGEDTPAKREALAHLDRLNDTVVYGDLFDPTEVGKGYEHKGYLGIGRDAVKLAKHTWHQVLGDIACQAPGKTIVFSLGKNFKQYLEVLRWKNGLSVMLVDGHQHTSLDKATLKELYLKSQVLHLLADRHCDLARVQPAQLEKLINGIADKSNASELLCWLLHRYQVHAEWPSLLLETHNHWDFIKQLETNIIVLINSSESTVIEKSKMIRQFAGIDVNSIIFDIIPTKDKTLDWHYYLADAAHINADESGKNTLAITLNHNNLHRLDTLKWKKNLAVIYIDHSDDQQSVAERTPVTGLLNSTKAEIIEFKSKLDQMMQHRHCAYYQVDGNDDIHLLSLIKHYTTPFITQNQQAKQEH